MNQRAKKFKIYDKDGKLCRFMVKGMLYDTFTTKTMAELVIRRHKKNPKDFYICEMEQGEKEE